MPGHSGEHGERGASRKITSEGRLGSLPGGPRRILEPVSGKGRQRMADKGRARESGDVAPRGRVFRQVTTVLPFSYPVLDENVACSKATAFASRWG